jgi:hypothetical protein
MCYGFFYPQKNTRSEAAKAQHEVSKPYAGEKMVCEQSVRAPSKDPERKAKASASKTNPGAVAHSDKMLSELILLPDEVVSPG